MLQECAEVAILIFLVSFLPDSSLAPVGSGQRQSVRGARRKRAGKERAESFFFFVILKTMVPIEGKVKSAEVR